MPETLNRKLPMAERTEPSRPSRQALPISNLAAGLGVGPSACRGVADAAPPVRPAPSSVGRPGPVQVSAQRSSVGVSSRSVTQRFPHSDQPGSQPGEPARFHAEHPRASGRRPSPRPLWPEPSVRRNAQADHPLRRPQDARCDEPTNPIRTASAADASVAKRTASHDAQAMRETVEDPVRRDRRPAFADLRRGKTAAEAEPCHVGTHAPQPIASAKGERAFVHASAAFAAPRRERDFASKDHDEVAGATVAGACPYAPVSPATAALSADPTGCADAPPAAGATRLDARENVSIAVTPAARLATTEAERAALQANPPEVGVALMRAVVSALDHRDAATLVGLKSTAVGVIPVSRPVTAGAEVAAALRTVRPAPMRSAEMSGRRDARPGEESSAMAGSICRLADDVRRSDHAGPVDLRPAIAPAPRDRRMSNNSWRAEGPIGSKMTFAAARDEMMRDLRRVWMGSDFKRGTCSVLAASLRPAGTPTLARTLEAMRATLANYGKVYDVGPDMLAVIMPSVALHQAHKAARVIAAAIDARSAEQARGGLLIAAAVAALHRDEDPSTTVCLAENCLGMALASDRSRVVGETDPGVSRTRRAG